jgi:putative addiction module killer protein
VKLEKAPEFLEWVESLTKKEQGQVASRLQRVEIHDHFGDAKGLGEGLSELRWKNGWRVYFAKAVRSDGSIVILLLGGLKNDQKKDIERARLLLRRYASS